jgi:hypothetical protein
MVGTTDQAQFWAHGRFSHPTWFLQKRFADNIVVVVLNRFMKFFRYKCSTFEKIKICKSYVLFSPVKDDKLKTSRNVGKDETWIWIYKG